jgi:N-dimethylarginine dimethylaminohydrolase
MAVWSDWDPLEEVIVGDCYAPGALDWFIDPSLQDPFNQILFETKQDLDNLAELLANLNIRVHRPTVYNYTQGVEFSSFAIRCPTAPIVPRDQYLIYGDVIFQTFTSMTDRYVDGHSFYNIFKMLFDRGHNWISQPAPVLKELSDNKKWMSQGKMVYDKLYQRQILWHTATMLKCGDKLVTNTGGPGNSAGLEWMKRNLPTDTVIDTNNVMKNWGHIDHGFFMTNDQTVFCLNKSFVPECLKNKTVHEIEKYMPDPLIQTGSNVSTLLDESKGYEQTVSFDTNVLILDSSNIVVSSVAPKLFDFFNSLGINCHVAPFRHRDFWAAGIHCVTLDIRRRGKKRKIVNEI